MVLGNLFIINKWFIKMRKYKLEKSIIFNTNMLNFEMDLNKAWYKLKSEIVLISEINSSTNRFKVKTHKKLKCNMSNKMYKDILEN